MRCQWLSIPLAAGLAAAGACTQEASLRIHISAPEGELSPLDARLSQVTLQISGPTIETQIQSRTVVRGEALELGEVPIADDLSITMVATDAAGRLLGFGRGDGPVDVRLGDDAEIEVRVRRPFAYMTGGPSLSTFDTTRDSTQAYLTNLNVGGSPDAIAVTPDGAYVVVVAGNQVRLVDTATHADAGMPAVAVQPQARDAAVSADGRFLAIAHETGVSFIPVADLIAGTAQVTFLSVGSADMVAFSNTTAWVLIQAGRGEACPGTGSSLVPVDLATLTAGQSFAMGTQIADLATDATDGSILVATPCLNRVQLLSDASAEPILSDFTPVMDVPRAGAVAVAGRRVWALGSIDSKTVNIPADPPLPSRIVTDGTAHLVLAVRGLEAGAPAHTTIDLDTPEERAKADEFGLEDVPGQSAEVLIGADVIRPLDLAVLPDGSRLVVLWNASYDSVVFGIDPIFGNPLISTLQLTTSEYQLLDASTGSPLQRMRTRCGGTSESNGILAEFVCTQAQGQDQAPGSLFTPADVAVLFGER